MMMVTRMLQDCGGHLSPQVVRMLKAHWPRLAPYRAMAIGQSVWKLGEEKSESRCKLMIGNSSLVKDSISGILAIEIPHGGYVHFPVGEDGSDAAGFSIEFFEQLVESEKKELVIERGLRHWRWKQVRERNEALDCFVMALVALETLALDLNAMAPIVAGGGPGESEKGGEYRRSDGTSSLQRPRIGW